MSWTPETTGRVTQLAIAKEANVSRSTVAAILCNLPTARVSPEVRQRVVDAAARLGYRPNRYAQVMRKGKSGVIGIVDLGGFCQLSQRKVRAVAREILQQDYELHIQEPLWFSGVGGDEGQMVTQRLLDMHVEGVVLSHPSLLFSQEYLEQFLAAGIPVVALGGRHLQGIPCFYSDREAGYYTMVRHLLGLGYRHIAIMGNNSPFIKAGAQRAVLEHGSKSVRLEYIEHELVESGSPKTYIEKNHELGRTAMEVVLRWKKRPEAVVFGNDEQANGALTACAEHGVRVPKDIAITGFDDSFSSAYGPIPLTTVSQPIEALAQRAADCLLKMIRSGQSPKAQEVKLMGQLVVRRSCGAKLRQ